MTDNPSRGEPGTSPGDAWPTEIRLRQNGVTLAVAFDNGEAFDLPAEYLRVFSPSAEVQGHGADERQTVGGKRNVAIIEIQPIGHYAVRLTFDDMHSTGLFSWTYLMELGREQAANWGQYLDDLAAKGLSREPLKR